MVEDRPYPLRVRGILFNPWTFWVVGNFWGSGLLRASTDEIRLSGPFHRRHVPRTDETRLRLDNYLWRAPCLVFEAPAASTTPLYFALTGSDCERTVPQLRELGWQLTGWL